MNGKEEAFGFAGSQYVPQLWMKYRLTREAFLKIWNEQEGLCGGCKEVLAHPFEKKLKMGCKPTVDYDKERQIVRGITCRSCNSFVDLMHENKFRINNLIEYLRKTESW